MSVVYPTVRTAVCDVLAVGGRTESCVLRKNRLLPALSAVSFTVAPSREAKSAFYSVSDGRAYAICADALIYTDDFSSYFTVCHLTDEPFAYNTGDGINYGFLSGTKYVNRANDGYYIRNHECNLRDGVYKNGRIFAVSINDGYRIVWTAADTPESFDGDWGYVRINTAYGQILKLVTCGDNIVAVCKHGLAVLTACGTPESFKLSYNLRKMPEIFTRSVCGAGGKVYFTTTEGAYRSDGKTAEKLDCRYLDEIVAPKSAIAHDGGYFLAGLNAAGENIVAAYDTADGTGYFIRTEAGALCAGGKVYGFGKDYACAFESGGKFVFESDALTFGTPRKKTLEEVEIFAAEKVDVEIKSGGKSRIFRGVNGKIRPRMRGESFVVKVTGGCEVDKITAYAEAIDGY